MFFRFYGVFINQGLGCGTFFQTNTPKKYPSPHLNTLKKASNWLWARVKTQFLINGDAEDLCCWKLLMTYAEQSEAENLRF